MNICPSKFNFCLVLERLRRAASSRAFLCSLLVFTSGWAAMEARSQDAIVVVDAAQAVDEEDDDDEDEGDAGAGKYMGGAMLKTDPDLASLLKKADEYKKDGNYRVASKFWQAVLERSGDTLYSDDGETYYAMTERVESILGDLPDEGLRAYRISADAAAKEIMAQASGEYDVETLSQIVKTYFMSSLGDEAAYQLSGIFMDQFDFVAATRLLRKITDQYPGPSVPLEKVWLQLAVAYTYLGDTEMAKQALTNATEIGRTNVQVMREIEQLVAASPQLQDLTTSSSEWTMRLGGPRRFGVMPSLPKDYLTQDLGAVWQFHLEPMRVFDETSHQGAVLRGEGSWNADNVRKKMSASEQGTIKRWTQKRWRPAGHLLFTEKEVVFKTGGDVTVWDRQPGEYPKWRPLWFNVYEEDQSSQMLRSMSRAYGQRNSGNSNSPSTTEEIMLFSDRVHQSTSVYRGRMFNIEGENYAIGNEPKVRSTRNNRGFQYGQMPRRGRNNALTAYDMSSGKLLWRQPQPKLLTDKGKSDEETEAEGSELIDPFEDVGFMSAPVGVGDMILVPVSQSGSISVYAMDVEDGSLIWQSYLCDEPSSGSAPYSPMEITVQGSSAYVSCGTGVLFSIDPLTGTIQYARRYERSAEDDPSMQNFGVSGAVRVDGWEVDLVLPVGNILMLFASDYSAVWAIDRQTAKFIWKTENRPFNSKFEYLIGVYNDKVYLGGKDSIAAISISAQGRWEWVEEFGDDYTYGRAMLTPDGIYVPFKDSIALYSLEGKMGSGEQLAQVGVRLGTEAPVGNLFSDGEKIWVVGANRLYLLEPLPPKQLDEEKEEGDEQQKTQTEQAEGDDDKDDDNDNDLAHLPVAEPNIVAVVDAIVADLEQYLKNTGTTQTTSWDITK